MIIPFMNIDVAIKAEKGPKAPALISLKGRINRLIMKIPNGGIQIFRKMDCISVEPLHTYCIHPLHKNVRAKEIPGSNMQPRKENDQSIRVGNDTISPKVTRVRITACTIPKVCCMA